MEQIDHAPQVESESETENTSAIAAVNYRQAPVQEKMLENTILSALTGRGFTVVPYSSWILDPGRYGKELVLQQVPYTTIYGHRGFTQFLVRSEKHNLKIRIKYHWQQFSGSMDEKLPYLYLNSVYAIPEQDVIIIIGGGGLKAGAVKWLRKAVQKHLFQNEELRHQKNIRIQSIDEFLAWVNSIGVRASRMSADVPLGEKQDVKVEKRKDHLNEQQLEFSELISGI